MSETTDVKPAKATGDLVLQEVWHAKDSLSAQYGHDLDKLFTETHQHEKVSGHLMANLPIKRRKA